MKKLRNRKLCVMVEQEIYEKLMRLAKTDYRTVSGLVRHILRRHILEAEDRKKATFL